MAAPAAKKAAPAKKAFLGAAPPFTKKSGKATGYGKKK